MPNSIRNARYRITAEVEQFIRRVKRLGMSPDQVRRDVFSEIYSEKLWGRESDGKFFSGVGSRGEAAATYSTRMADELRDFIAKSKRTVTIVDLGCGDFQVGRALLAHLPENVAYVGCDIVPELIAYNTEHFATPGIRFQTLDIVMGNLPEGDVCLVRQVLQHLSNSDIAAFLSNEHYLRLYVTEGQPSKIVGSPNPDKPASAHVRFDCVTGKGRGVELDKPPFDRIAFEVFRVIAQPHEIIVTFRVFEQPQGHPTLYKADRTGTN